MARTEGYTPEQMIAALTETKGLQYLAARRLGCHPDTITDYKKRHPEIAACVNALKGEQVDVAEAALMRAVNAGEAWAVCFFLKTQAKNRGYVERQEIQAEIRQELTDDDICARADAILERGRARRAAAIALNGEAVETGTRAAD